MIEVPMEIEVSWGELGFGTDSTDQRIIADMAADFAAAHYGASPILKDHAGWPEHGASPILRRRAGWKEPGARPEEFHFQGPTTGFGAEVGKKVGLDAANPNDRAVIDKYMREAGIPQSSENIAWCAAWLNAQLAHEGVQGSGALSVASFRHWGRPETASQARAGDVMIVYGGAHVGRFTGDVKDGKFGFYSGNAGEPGEPAPPLGRSQWGGVKEQWLNPAGVEFRAPTSRERYQEATMKAAAKPAAPSGAGHE